MSGKNDYKSVSRRHFLNTLGLGGAGIVLVGSYGFYFRHDSGSMTIKAIAVDFEKCAGCRTCEAVCSAFNNKVDIEGIKLDGLGNPSLSNIRVHHYNPDVDIPSTCALCEDAPCIAACPVEPHQETGRRALYKNPETETIVNDLHRCIGCSSCAMACKEERAGVIYPNPETGSPEKMCTLCGGDPQCVINCPYDALTYVEINDSRDKESIAPGKIAERLVKKLYNLNLEEV